MKHVLWYESKAGNWNEALPIGNGRLGAMVFGDYEKEVLRLNEDTMWFGGPRERQNPEAAKYLPEIRRLLFEGKPKEAARLSYLTLTSIPKYFGAYQPLGDLRLWFEQGDMTEYRRMLDIDNALATVTYRLNGVQVKREYFASCPDQVIAIRITAEEPILTMFCNFMRRPFDGDFERVDGETVAMHGQLGENGVTYTAMLTARSDGKTEQIGDYLSFSEATEIELFFTAYTSFRTENPRESCLTCLKQAKKKSYAELIKRHTEDYHSLYRRVELELDDENCDLPTNRRLERLQSGVEDNDLLALYFHYGRYLMISSSREGTMAMNLQGIWNCDYAPPWECNYTININTEMNYWPAEICNLPECHFPLFDLLDRMVINGRKTARDMYGCEGFVAHHCTDLWADTAVEGIMFPSPVWPMGGAWLAIHLWEHYLFTKDTVFLRERAYPVMREACLFFMQYMTKDAEGFWVTGPTLSPENTYIMPDKTEGYLCMGAEMDNQILHELFGAVIDSAKILNTDQEFAEQLAERLKKIRTPRINSYGGIMEWPQDYEEKELGHRHVSHLFSLYPGTKITPEKTPELAAACEKTLEHRMSFGGGHTGWSCAWIISLFARLNRGEKALQCLYRLLDKTTYPNLFNVHPPFQIDGNMGGTAAIAEMLLQSHDGVVRIMPAVPKSWRTGHVCGLAARGGFAVSFWWRNNRIERAEIKSLQGGKCQLEISENLQPDFPAVCRGGKLEFETEPGKTYVLTQKAEK